MTTDDPGVVLTAQDIADAQIAEEEKSARMARAMTRWRAKYPRSRDPDPHERLDALEEEVAALEQRVMDLELLR